jgi:hypothetical protein
MDCRADRLPGKGVLKKRWYPCPRTPITQAAEHQIDVGALREKVAYFAQEVCAVVLIKGDVVNIRELNACFTQAISDRLRRKSCPMLYTPESLLLRGSNQLTVSYQCG